MFATLIAPNYFSGQLLTDRDLNAGVDWTRARFALVRHRGGWGIVCGLEVRRDPKEPARVIVGPGYAIDAAGRDLTLHEDLPVDLSQAVEPELVPCGSTGGGGTPNEDGSEVAVDLVAAAQDTPDDPQAALGQACGQTTCQPARTVESIEVTYRPATHDPVAEAASAFADRWAACAEILTRFRDRYGQQPGNWGGDMRAWLLARLAAHEPHMLDLATDSVPDELDEAAVAALLFWVVLDARVALAARCAGCEDPCIPLARVYLSTRAADGTAESRVKAIDRFVPYARSLGGDRWPAPLGELNAARLLWQRDEEARLELADLGFTPSPANFQVPDTLAALDEWVGWGPFFGLGDPGSLQVLDDGRFGRRVVGLAAAADISLRIEKTTGAASAAPGETVAYTVTVTNTGRTDLDIEVSDPASRFTTDAIPLAAGQNVVFDLDATVPDDGAGNFENTATVTGTAADGRTVSGQATCSVKISRGDGGS